MNNLKTEQRAFFRQIKTIAFSNPFGLEREQADYQLLGASTEKQSLIERQIKIQEQLHWQLQQIEPFNIGHYQGEQRDIMILSWLFYVFHEFQDRFNAFIEAQKRAGGNSIVLPFAEELIAEFNQSGFNQPEAEKYTALFYQLHRGFYFISQAVSGDCPVITELRKRLWNNIFTFNPEWYLNYLCGNLEDFSTLLLGETGTGKSLVAQAIGCSGFIPFDSKKQCFKESFKQSFVSINLSQYPDNLLESELFGHKKGAFTGAIDHHQGIFARCSQYGAVFIDEIGDIDIATQVKLLNVIQDRQFCPVGSHESERFAGRVISATNRDIRSLRTDGLFRDDLYYRLCSDVIIVPSLLQRIQENPDELLSLVKTLIARVITNSDENLAKRIHNRIMNAVPENYSWPGNVRELEQCIRSICLTGGYTISLGDKSNKVRGFVFDMEKDSSALHLLQTYCDYLYQQSNNYESVARITQLDRRTVKKYILGHYCPVKTASG